MVEHRKKNKGMKGIIPWGGSEKSYSRRPRWDKAAPKRRAVPQGCEPCRHALKRVRTCTCCTYVTRVGFSAAPRIGARSSLRGRKVGSFFKGTKRARVGKGEPVKDDGRKRCSLAAPAAIFTARGLADRAGSAFGVRITSLLIGSSGMRKASAFASRRLSGKASPFSFTTRPPPGRAHKQELVPVRILIAPTRERK